MTLVTACVRRSGSRALASRVSLANVEVNGLFSDEDLGAAAEELEPDSPAALIVWENVWARKTAQAFRDAGGVVLDFERLPHHVVQAARKRAAANA